MPKDWSEFECKLIDIIKNEYPILHNPAVHWTASYRTAIKKAWSAVASRFPHVTPTECCTKWMSIRKCFKKMKTKPKYKHSASKYLDGKLDFLVQYMHSTEKRTETRPTTSDSDLVSGESQSSILNSCNISENQCQTSININECNVRKTKHNRNIVTIENIDRALSEMEDDLYESACVTQDIIESILMSNNIYFNIISEETTQNEPNDTIVHPAKKHKATVVNSNTKKSRDHFVNTIMNPCLTVREMPVDEINSPTIVEAPNSGINNGLTDMDLPASFKIELEPDDVEEQNNALCFINEPIERSTKEFFTNLGDYVVSRFSAEKQTELKSHILSIIQRAELDA